MRKAAKILNLATALGALVAPAVALGIATPPTPTRLTSPKPRSRRRRGFEPARPTVKSPLLVCPTDLIISHCTTTRTAAADGGQRNLGLTSDSSQFVCHRIECAQRV